MNNEYASLNFDLRENFVTAVAHHFCHLPRAFSQPGKYSFGDPCTVSEKQTCTPPYLQDEYYLDTRRVIDFDRLVRTIVMGFSSKDLRKPSNSTSATTSTYAGTGRDDEAAAAIESLKQIVVALTSGVSTEGAPSVALTKTVGDLMALIPRQGKEL